MSLLAGTKDEGSPTPRSKFAASPIASSGSWVWLMVCWKTWMDSRGLPNDGCMQSLEFHGADPALSALMQRLNHRLSTIPQS